MRLRDMTHYSTGGAALARTFSDGGKGLRDVLEQIISVLNADGEADGALTDA